MNQTLKRRLYPLQLLSASIGAATSIYLLVQHTRLKTGIQGDSSLCNFGPYADCNVANSSVYSEIAGMPIAAFGVLFFLTLLVLGLFPPRSRSFAVAQVWMARLSLAALAVDAFLLAVQGLVLHSFCLFCLSTYAATLASLALNWFQIPPDERSIRALLKGDPKEELPAFGLAVLVVILMISALGMFGYVDSMLGSVRSAEMEKAKKALVEGWNSMPSRPIAVKSDDPVWGNPDAKIQVVVFSDFECPHCKKAAFALHTALTPEREKVRLVYKNFPLDMACNPLLKQPLHQNACMLARLGYCANKKGKFWDFHDRVYFNLAARELSGSRDDLYDGIKKIFTRKEFDDCLESPESVANTRADIDLGASLQITGTPSVFINGKRVPYTPTVDLVRELVQKEESLAK